jgi:MtrB/PioB family decaheme-associated outer membrane protein
VKSTSHPFTALLALALALPLAAGLHAQTPFAGGTIYREFDLGGRFFLHEVDRTERAFFERYRDLEKGLILPNFRLWYLASNAKTLVEARALNAGYADQRYTVTASRLGTWRMQYERDQTPHLFSTNGYMLGAETSRGVYSLPDPRPTTTDWNAAVGNTNFLLSSIGFRSDRDRVSFRVTPGVGWSLQARYDHVRRHGDRPIGMSFGSPGNNTREIPEPVDHVMHAIRITPAYAGRRYQLQLSYDYSAFDNETPRVLADNPLVAASTATGGAATGSTGLAPDNHAHTVTLNAGVSLPLLARVAGSYAIGWRVQDQRFEPYTINTAISVDTLNRLRALPANLDGDVRTSTLFLTGSARPVGPVSLSVRHRRYELDDRTPALTVPGRVVSDRSLSIGDMHRENYSHTRKDTGIEGRWRLTDWIAMNAAYQWQEWSRNEHTRERATATERTPSVGVSLSPLDWLNVRATWLEGRRDGSDYTAVAAAQLPELRKFDQADVDRHRLNLFAEAGPVKNVDLALTYTRGRNDYENSAYGLQQDDNDVAGADVSWTPSPRLGFTVGYLTQRWRSVQRGRFRVPPSQLDNLTYDWVARNRDRVRTTSFTLAGSPIERKLDVSVGLDIIRGRAKMLTANPTPPTGGTEAQNASATAIDLPDRTYRLTPFTAVVRYRLRESWTASVRYSEERFRSSDFRSDELMPSTGGDIFLGNDLENYYARYITVTLAFRPFVAGLRRAPY